MLDLYDTQLGRIFMAKKLYIYCISSFIILGLIGCQSELNVSLNTADIVGPASPKSFNVSPLDGENGVEARITLEYKTEESKIAEECSVYNLKNLSESSKCACDSLGVCSVGVTGIGGYSGPVSFDYSITSDEIVSNVATVDFKLKLVEIYAGQLSSDSDSYLSLDVHWGTRTVLLGVGSGNRCISAVDITDLTAPAIYNSIGTNTVPSTSGSTCRDIKIIENGTKFIVPTYAKHTEVWTFGGDSKDPTGWAELFDLNTTTKMPKRLSHFVDNGATYDFVISTYGGLVRAELDKGTNVISVLNNGTAAYDMTHSIIYQDAAYIGDDLIVATEPGVGKDIKIFAADSSLVETIPLQNASDYMWSSATSADQTMIAIGGQRLALLSYDGTVLRDTDKVTLEYEIGLDSSMRSMVFFDYQSSRYLAGAFGDGSVRIFNVDDISNPTLVKKHQISAFDGEAYDLKIVEAEEIIFVAGTKGKFAILSIPGLM